MDHSHHQHNHEHDSHEHDPAGKHASDGAGKHAGHSVEMFRNKFWLSLFLTLPVVAYSDMIQQWFNFSPPEFFGSEYVPFVLSTIIFFYGGMVFIRGAIQELQSKLPGMMTLISLAITTAYFYSIATLFLIEGEGFFWELATLVTIMLLGHWLEMASIQRAESALNAISELLPDKAEKLINGQPKQVLVSELKIGDLVLIRPGTSIPVDGVVTEGDSSVDEAAITGESKPVSKTTDDEVVAGTINQDGSLTVKVTNLGDNTVLAGIMKLVAEAQGSKSRTQILADKAAFVLTLTAVITGLITFIVWLIIRDADFALERMVTVLIIACPHALGLAIPLVVSISTTMSARNGLLVRKRLALESARNINTVLFDKTGTLTKGEHGVTDIWASEKHSDEEVLGIAASLEQNSEHIIGKGIVDEAQNKNIKLDKISSFTALPGLGVKGELDGKEYMVVSYRYIDERGLTVSKHITEATKQAAKKGKTVVYVVEQDKIIGALGLADVIRPESKETVEILQSLGIKTAMITGDSNEVAAYVAKQLGLDQYFGEVKPEDKAAKVKDLQKDGGKVAMVGDGVNDAPALTQADIGIAIGAGTDIAIKSADIILTKSDPRDVIKVINLSKASYRKMVQNLIWAAGYNVLAIPLAAGVLYGSGIILIPAVGAVLMSASTVIVALNAQLLRRFNLAAS